MRHTAKWMAGWIMSISCLSLLAPVCGPSANEPAQVLEKSYTGFLHLRYTQNTPPIEATAQMAVSVDRFGNMTFTPGALLYEGEAQVSDDARLRRSGQVALAPTGSWFESQGEDWFQVIENGTGQDRTEEWVFDGTDWQKIVDFTLPISWTGGLAFKLADAETTGSVVEVNTGEGLVRWTLNLVPDLVD